MSSAQEMTGRRGQELPCEVTLLAGFLGAGKTTLLKRILSWPADISSTAVLVNEFGKVGIDGEILRGRGVPVIELTNGCICCTIQGDLLRTVTDVLNRFAPRRMLVEATGVADPFEILTTLKLPQLIHRLSVQKIVTVLDADIWKGREILGPLFFNQIRAAQLVLLNKVDLLSPEEIPECLSEIQKAHPSGTVVPTHYCQIDPETLWTEMAVEGKAPDAEWIHASHEDAHTRGFVTFSFEEEAPFRRECFRQFLAGLPVRLYRVKGFALLGAERFLVNHVGGKTEWMGVDERGPTRLAFVGWGVDGEEVLSQLRDCLDR